MVQNFGKTTNPENHLTKILKKLWKPRWFLKPTLKSQTDNFTKKWEPPNTRNHLHLFNRRLFNNIKSMLQSLCIFLVLMLQWQNCSIFNNLCIVSLNITKLVQCTQLITNFLTTPRKHLDKVVISKISTCKNK